MLVKDLHDEQKIDRVRRAAVEEGRLNIEGEYDTEVEEKLSGGRVKKNVENHQVFLSIPVEMLEQSMIDEVLGHPVMGKQK